MARILRQAMDPKRSTGELTSANEIDKKFLTILRNSGFPSLEFGQKIDFEKLYKERLN